MSDVKHTALPWRIGDAGQTVFGPPNGSISPTTIAHTIRADAAYIVLACNAYPALVEALKGIVKYRDSVGALGFQLEKLDDYLNIARAALAQAQGDE